MSLVDLSELKSHYGEDIEIIEDLVEIFESTYPDTISELEKAIKAEDYEKIELHAHTLKGMVANFFAKSTKENCFIIEKKGRDKEAISVDELENIKKDLPNIIEELKKI